MRRWSNQSLAGTFAVAMLCAGALAGPSAQAAAGAAGGDPAGSSVVAEHGPKVSIGYSHLCWIRRDKSLWCGGSNEEGQLGDPSLEDDDIVGPVRIGSATDTWVDTAAGWEHGCGIQENGTLWCWGDDLAGQLGDGRRNHENDLGDPQSKVERIGTGTTWARVVAGAWFTCGLQRDGSLWCWGGYPYPAAADDHIRNAPEQIEGTWVRLSAGYGHACAVRDDGSLWCWGNNKNGELGDGTTLPHLSPVRVGTGTDWTDVSAGGEQTCALRADRTLWCWGGNEHGGLGDGTLTPRSVPGQVGTDHDWVQVATGHWHACARRSNGTAWCWGTGEHGQLGNGDAANRSLPTPVAGDASWAGVWAGTKLTCGVRTDDSIWCWGDHYELETVLTGSELVPTPLKEVPCPRRDAAAG